jgi:hypothetical protein
VTESKKEWVKPELIVLVRSKSEEAVLGACKGFDVSVGPNETATSCSWMITGPCTICNSYVLS